MHIAERRYFDDDMRRHFAGEVIGVSDNTIRIKGYVWVFNSNKGEFQKRPKLRERVIVLGERHTVNILPENVSIDDLKYVHEEGQGLVVTDEKDFEL